MLYTLVVVFFFFFFSNVLFRLGKVLFQQGVLCLSDFLTQQRALSVSVVVQHEVLHMPVLTE